MSQHNELMTLNHLLIACKDGAQGFAFAAEHVTDPDLRDLFTALADERGRFAEELAPHLHRLGGQGLSAGSAGGAIHRGWMNVKSALRGSHDAMLVAEAERGERHAMHAYEVALADLLPPTVMDIVARQYEALRDAHARIAALGHGRQAHA